MKITGNLLGSSVTIVNIERNGLEIYATYIDSTQALKVARFNASYTLSGTPILSGAVSVK